MGASAHGDLDAGDGSSVATPRSQAARCAAAKEEPPGTENLRWPVAVEGYESVKIRGVFDDERTIFDQQEPRL